MEHEVLVKCIRLIRSPGIGAVTYFDAVQHFGSEEDAIDAFERKGNKIFSPFEAEKEIRNHEKIGASLLCYKDPRYPPMLKSMKDCPPVISVLGKISCLSLPSISIVGARAASLNGKRFAENLALELGSAGYIITSGLARGIDGAAHKGALKTGTIAVLAGGVDRIYPPEHHKLRDEILEKGAVISEMPLDLFPGAKHFPRRNRLIAALSKGVCVIEAGRPSGTIITAGYALDYGRELFAVPGFPGDPRSVGCNYLLKTGAYVLEGAEDVFNILGYPNQEKEKSPLKQFSEIPLPSPFTDIAERILTQLSAMPCSVSDLANAIQVPPDTIHSTLIDLEMMGKVDCDQAGNISLRV